MLHAERNRTAAGHAGSFERKERTRRYSPEPRVQHILVLEHSHLLPILFFGPPQGFLLISSHDEGLLLSLGEDGRPIGSPDVIDGQAMAPPELATDAPVVDASQPVEPDLLEAIGNDRQLLLLDSSDGSLGHAVHLEEPLLRQQRLDHFARPLRDGNPLGVLLLANHESLLLHVCPKLLATLESVEVGVLPGELVHAAVLLHHRQHGQAMSLADLVVIHIVSGCDFQRPGTKFSVHIGVADHYETVEQVIREDNDEERGGGTYQESDDRSAEPSQRTR